jgi:predicted nucleic acid-binding protein
VESISGDAVFDTNVVVKFFFHEEHHEKAKALMRRFTGTARRMVVPDFLFAEFVNILWLKVRRRELAEGEAGERIAQLLVLSAYMDVVPIREVLHRTLEASCRLDHAAYDTAFLVIAADREIPLITADTGLERKCRKYPAEVKLLGEMSFAGSPETGSNGGASRKNRADS